MSAFVPIIASNQHIRRVPGQSNAACHAMNAQATLRHTSFVCRPFEAPVLPPRTSACRARRTPTCTLTVERLTNKSYQLEEDEDQSSCTTAIYLNENGTVSVGRTDGPSPDRVHATWEYNDESGELILDIERYFIGEAGVEFMVKRILRGHLDERRNLENLPVFIGAMYPHPTDFSKYSEVGWFAMILATDDLPSDDYDISASNWFLFLILSIFKKRFFPVLLSSFQAMLKKIFPSTSIIFPSYAIVYHIFGALM